MSTARNRINDPYFWKKVWLWQFAFWTVFLIPLNVWWADSTRLINNMSAIALSLTAFCGYQASRAEIESATNPPQEGIDDPGANDPS